MMKRIFSFMLVIALCVSNLLIGFGAPQQNASWGYVDPSVLEGINPNDIKLGDPISGKTWMAYNIADAGKAKDISKYDGNTKIDQIDFVIFGSYPYGSGANAPKQSLRWVVLEKQQDKALLLSQYLLDISNINSDWYASQNAETYNPYNRMSQMKSDHSYKNVDDMKMYIEFAKEFNKQKNDYIAKKFLSDAFAQDEISYIIDTDMSTKVNSFVYVDEWTADYSRFEEKLVYNNVESIVERNKVFQLSVDEYNKYLKSAEMRKSKLFSAESNSSQELFYESRDNYISNRGFFEEVHDPSVAYDANTGNKYDDAGKVMIDTSYEIGYRPAVWVKINSSNENLSSQTINEEAPLDYDLNSAINQMDIVTFGSYPQSDVTGVKKEPIKWQVLDRDVQNNRALLFSVNILDSDSFNTDTKIKTTYENSVIRKVLNNNFYNKAFNDNEKNYIITTNNANEKNSKFDIAGGNNTEDKVFLLSENEIRKYYKIEKKLEADIIDSSIYAEATEYSQYLDSRGDSKKPNCFWLRSPGRYDNQAQNVNLINLTGLYLDLNGERVDKVFGIRPAMWVSYNPNVGKTNIDNLSETSGSKANTGEKDSNNILGDNVNIEGANVYQNSDGSIQIGGEPGEGATDIKEDLAKSDAIDHKKKKVDYSKDQVIINNADIVTVNAIKDNGMRFLLTDGGYEKYRQATERNLALKISVVFNTYMISEISIDSVFGRAEQVICYVDDRTLRDSIVESVNNGDGNIEFVEGNISIINDNDSEQDLNDEIDKIISDSNEATLKKPIDRVYYYAKHDVTNKTVTSINKKNSSNGLLGTGLFSNKTYYNIEIKFNEDTKKRLSKYAELEWNGSYKSGQDWILLAGNTMNDLENVSWFGITPFKDNDRVANTKELSYYQKGTLQVHSLSANEQNRVYNKLKNAKVIVLATRNVIKDDRIVFSEEEKLGNVERFEYVKDDGSHINLVNAYIDCEEKVVEYTNDHNGYFLYVKDGFTGDLAYHEEIVAPKKKCNKFDILVFGNDSLSYSIYGNKVNFLAGKEVGGLKKFQVFGGKMDWIFELNTKDGFEDYENYYQENKDKW